MDINLQVFVDGEKQILRMKNVTEERGIEVVRNFFNATGGLLEDEIRFENSGGNIGKKIKGLITQRKDDEILVGAKPTTLKAAKETDEPEFWTTGIKVSDDGVKRYKCHYNCECGARGNHYIPLGKEVVTCRECGYHLDTQPAGKLNGKGIPQRDDHGNFFVANHWDFKPSR